MSTQPKTFNDHPLAICFSILSLLGKPGEYVWLYGKTFETMKARVSYLQDAIEWLRKKAKEGVFRELPVDFKTFVCSELLLNKKDGLWPVVLEEGATLNNGNYVESVLTGGIGVGKTHLAIYTQAYQLYVLSCLKNAHQLFDLDDTSEIVIIFQSINKNLAMDVDYRAFRKLIQGSPYFSALFPFDPSRESEMRFPRSIVVKPVAGHDTAAIGQNVIGGIQDEVNFQAVVEDSKQSRDGGTYDQAAKNYNSIARRRESRFMSLGALPGMLCLVSSRNYPGQFTDRKEAEARDQIRTTGKTTIFIYDKKVWQVKPWQFSGEMFPVFIGDDTRKPRVIEEGEEVAITDRHLILEVPVEYKSKFYGDLLPALRDIGGVATQALHPFMLNTEAVAKCFGKVPGIASREDCDFKASRILLYPKKVIRPDEPRFAHIDLAVSKDSAGISIGWVPGFREMKRGDYTEMLPEIQFDLVLEVRPPRGGEIEFEKIRQLVYTIRDKLGINVKWVSFDSYQSKDSMQIMKPQGFIVGYQSVDTDTMAYDVTKQAFYDDRILAPHHLKAQKEMVTLEIDTKKNKIDHPPNGSKDVADSMAGVVIGLTLRREIWSRYDIPTHRIPRSFAEPKGQTKESITKQERREAS